MANETDAKVTTEPVGNRLRQERLTQGLSINDIAIKTKISEKYLIAIEEEDFAALPEGSYPAILIKSYARFLAMDFDTLLQDYYRQRMPAKNEKPKKNLEFPLQQLLSEPLVRRLIIGAGVLVAITLIFRQCSENASWVADSQDVPVLEGEEMSALDESVTPSVSDDATRVEQVLAGGTDQERRDLAAELRQRAETTVADTSVAAAELYRLYARLDPDFNLDQQLETLATRLYQVGAALFSQRKFNAAKPLLADAVAIYGRDAYHHYLYGRSLDITGETRAAEREYREAIRINRPAYAKYHYYLGVRLFRRGALAEARQELLKYREVGGDPKYDHQAALLLVQTAG